MSWYHLIHIFYFQEHCYFSYLLGTECFKRARNQPTKYVLRIHLFQQTAVCLCSTLWVATLKKDQVWQVTKQYYVFSSLALLETVCVFLIILQTLAFSTLRQVWIICFSWGTKSSLIVNEESWDWIKTGCEFNVVTELSSALSQSTHTSVLLRGEAGVWEVKGWEEPMWWCHWDGMRGEFIEDPILSGPFKIFYRLS